MSQVNASDQAIQRVAVAVAVFDAGWPVPDLHLFDGDPGDAKASLGRSLVNLETLPAAERPTEAAVGLRLLLVYLLAPAVVRGSPDASVAGDIREQALYIASYVPGTSPAATLEQATGEVREWLESPAVVAVVRTVADELERTRTLPGADVEARIRSLLPAGDANGPSVRSAGGD